MSTDQKSNIPKRKISPSKGDGFFDSTQLGWFDSLFTPFINKVNAKAYFLAKILRVEKDVGLTFPGYPNVRVRARIISEPTMIDKKITMVPSVIHHHLPEPLSTEDQQIINLYPEFEGWQKDLGGSDPKVGDLIRVDFKNRANITKQFGNGLIIAMHPKEENVAGDEGAAEAKPGNEAFTKESKLQECIKKRKKQSSKPSGGSPLVGENANRTISRDAPRQLNSSTDDPPAGGLDLIAQARKAWSSVFGSSAPTVKKQKPSKKNLSPGSTPPLPIEASPGKNIDTKNSNVDCEKIYAMKDFAGASDVNSPAARAAARKDPSAAGDSGAGAKKGGEIKKTWHRKTNKLIRWLHPDYRAIAAKFINECDKRGYRIKITESYRTVQRQDELYSYGRFGPHKSKGWRTNARGNPRQSMHQFGLGFDIVEVSNGYDVLKKKRFNHRRTRGHRWTSGFDGKKYPFQRWHEIGRIGEEFGFKWGGRFRGRNGKIKFDGPHFQFVGIGPSRLRKKKTIVDPKLGEAFIYPKV